MKELSIEEKAKRYDEAIEKLRSLHDDYDTVNTLIDVKEELEHIFPELKESREDEMIRVIKEVILNSVPYKINILTKDTTITAEEAIAWLEKQGKNNMGISETTKQKLEDNLNKALEKATPESLGKFFDEQKPYGQRQECVNCQFNYAGECKGSCAMKRGEQKPAWSEEDELHIRELESLVKQVWAKAERENDKDTIHKMSDLSFFLKTLKPQPKQEWSEEDENTVASIISSLSNPLLYPPTIHDIEWLKSLLLRSIGNRVKSRLKH